MAASVGLFAPPLASPPPIHYIWIGPPKGSGIPGHDVAGPITMAKQNATNPIHFWCLAEHRDHYREKFRDLPNVKVNTVEELVAEAAEVPMLASIISPIQIRLDKINQKTESKEPDKSKNPIRDFVTLKDSLSLLLQSIKGRKGYVLDTNILPSEEKELKLPAHDKYRVPYIIYPAIPGKRKQQERADCWAMYCPPHSATGLKMLASYLEKVAAAEIEKQKELKAAPAKPKKGTLTPEQKYHDRLGSAICDTLLERKQKNDIESWPTQLLDQEANIQIREPGFPQLQKSYFNSHVVKRSSQEVPELYGQASVDNVPWLRFMLDQGEPINQQLKKTIGDQYFEGETLLHMAIRCDAKNCVRMLLEKGADPDLNAFYDGPMTARMLMEERPQDFAELLPLLKKPSSPAP